jgi:hypothetical protein
MSSSTTETNPPTYSWATPVGAVSSIGGLVTLAVCIAVSWDNRTEHGFAPMPAGATALACTMTICGLILCLFRILHTDRYEFGRRLDERLQAVDRKLDNVWGIAAKTSLEAVPARAAQASRDRNRGRGRRGRRPQDDGDADAEGGPGAVVHQLHRREDGADRLPSPDVLRQARELAAKVIRLERRRSEDRSEDTR